MYTAGTWRATIVVAANLLGAIRSAAPDWMPPERYALVTEVYSDGGEGVTQLEFDIDADNLDDVRSLAEDKWGELLRVAGVDAEEPQFAGFLPPTYSDARYTQLRREAQRWMEEERYDLAVLRAQTASEVLARVAIGGALRAAVGRAQGDALARVTTTAMTDRSTQRLLEALVGCRPDRAAWWGEYTAHLARRNHIAHAGTQITRHEAANSLSAVDNCMAWLTDLWAGRLSTDAS